MAPRNTGPPAGIFPIDAETLALPRAFRPGPETLIRLVEAYAKAQGLFFTDQTAAPKATYTSTLALDLSKVASPAWPALAAPGQGEPERRQGVVPQGPEGSGSAAAERRSPTANGSSAAWPRRPLRTSGSPSDSRRRGRRHRRRRDPTAPSAAYRPLPPRLCGRRVGRHRRDASCTACTSNPSVMLASGLVARKAVERVA